MRVLMQEQRTALAVHVVETIVERVEDESGYRMNPCIYATARSELLELVDDIISRVERAV